MEPFVQVPVPESLVATVIQMVAAHLDETVMTFATTAGPEPGLSGPAGAEETGDAEADSAAAAAWWEWLRPAERDLMEALAGRGPTEAGIVAERLGITASDLAGVLGPLNRRARRDGWPMILSRTRVSIDGSGRRSKLLTLSVALSRLVAARPESAGEDVPAPPPAKARRRSASGGNR